MDEDQLVEEVASLANTYLGAGIRVPNVESLSPDDRVDQIEDLLVRYFVVTGIDHYGANLSPSKEQAAPDVIPFVEKMPGRIQRIKHTTERSVELGRGEIRGRIDWPATVEARSRRGGTDDTLFAYRQTDDRAEIPANQVLATLVDRLYTTIGELRTAASESERPYQWLDPWLGSDSRLWAAIKQLKFQNPYISQIDVTEEPVPGQMIEQVRASRTPLYREAAKLLERYQRYIRGKYGEDELRDLFNTLFVKPENTDELFELYWAYRLVESFDDRQLAPLTGSSKIVARWVNDGLEYKLRYRSSSSEPPTFYIPLRDVEREKSILDREVPSGETYTQRKYAAVDRAATAKEEILGKSGVNRSLYNGEPDLLLTKRDRETGSLQGVFIGEVKWTQSGDKHHVARQAAAGIDDLCEYAELIRGDAKQYLAPEIGSVPIEAAVFTREYDPEQATSSSIRLVTYGDDLNQPLN